MNQDDIAYSKMNQMSSPRGGFKTEYNPQYTDVQQSENESYSPPPINDDESFMKELIEVEESLQRFEMETLRGMKLHIDMKKKKREYIKVAPNAPPLVNEIGIREILGRLRGRFTKIGRLTKKTNEEVIRDMFYFHMSLIDLFTDHADDWGMDESMVKPIIDSCVELVQDLTYSSREGFTATNVRSNYSRNESINTNQEAQTGRSFAGLRLKSK